MQKYRKPLIFIAYLIPFITFISLNLSGILEKHDPSGLSALGGVVASVFFAPIVICVLGVVWKMIVPAITTKYKLNEKDSTLIIVMGYFVISIFFTIWMSASIATNLFATS